MKTINVDSAFFKLIEDRKDCFTIITPVVRGVRQSWLTQDSINSVDLIEHYAFGRFQLWRWHTDNTGQKHKSPVTCITCPYVSTDRMEQITYRDKKTKKLIVVLIKSIEATHENGKWVWNITMEKQEKKRHFYSHSLLTYDELDSVVDFIQALDYKSVDLIVPSLYDWVKSNKITVTQFDILCTWYFK